MKLSALIGIWIGVPVFFAINGLAGGNMEKMKIQTIVVFGDSTTAVRGKLEIYANLLADELPARGIPAEIINAGIGGNTTQHAAGRFEKDVLEKQPDLVVIQFGINDSAVDVWENPPARESRVSKDQYIRNLENFVETLKTRNCRVILMTPNPIYWTPLMKSTYGKAPYLPDDPEGFNVMLREYAQAARQLAEKRKIPLVDVYAVFSAYGKVKNQNIKDLLLDGMHPNDKGHRIVADLLINEIVKLNNGRGKKDIAK
ncbi:MAG: SGNH/GDSL hydrolase family protein [bacterium]